MTKYSLNQNYCVEGSVGMENFAIPGVGGIIELTVDGEECILLQERYKEGEVGEKGLLEIPAGKIRAFEDIFDCLRREVREETGLTLTEIMGEDGKRIASSGEYQVVNYLPFACAQNIAGSYPILVQVFICKGEGELLQSSDESRGFRWVTIQGLHQLLMHDRERFYPMHIHTLERYIAYKQNQTQR